MANKTVINIDDEVEVSMKLTDFCGKEMVYVTLDNVQMLINKNVAISLQEALEKLVVNETYWYKTMQDENDKLQDRIEELEEQLECMGYSEAV